jgi:hypothetical protein
LSSTESFEVEDKCEYLLKEIGTYIFKKRWFDGRSRKGIQFFW